MRRMPTRVTALFLAFVLLWTGLSTIETSAVASPPPELQHLIADAGGLAVAHEGSVEHHHLDDLPSQAQSDPPTETPGLPPSPLAPSAQCLEMAQPRTFVPAAAGPPFLDGPLRPPCCRALAA